MPNFLSKLANMGMCVCSQPPKLIPANLAALFPAVLAPRAIKSPQMPMTTTNPHAGRIYWPVAL